MPRDAPPSAGERALYEKESSAAKIALQRSFLLRIGPQSAYGDFFKPQKLK